ncbi:MAG: carbohydrate-binding protein [Saprospirales bacterium]|nr:carbohydrate-binding protein [Saprospirales bacterium]
MKKLIFFLLLTIWSASLFAQTKSPKKGVAYGYHSQEDMAVLSEGISWWYNWYHQPDAGIFDTYQSLNVEFVPMTWNGGFNETALRSYLDDHPDVHYLLGFNEPNFVSQANMTPQQAAAIWPTLESIAEDYQLELVAPAVNYCDVCVDIPGTTNDNDPTAWLDAFFAECPDCKVDYIAIHWYACDVGALDWYVGLFEKYGLPIWITELACWENNPSLNTQMGYMIGALDLMEQDPRVFRYAWFSSRSNGPFNSLLENESGVLTPLGELYVNFNPVHDTTAYVPVPSRIEAENYARMQGILLQVTADVDGFANIGWTDAGDWLEYQIDASEAGTYPFKLRTAGMNAGVIEVQLDGIVVMDIPIPATGGWQNWNTLTSTIELTQGLHRLRLFVKVAGFNLNWLQIGSDEVVSINEVREERLPFRIFPQPVSDNQFTIQFEEELSEEVTLQLFNSTGERVYASQIQVDSANLQVSLPGLNGLFFLTLQMSGEIYTSKLMFHKK